MACILPCFWVTAKKGNVTIPSKVIPTESPGRPSAIGNVCKSLHILTIISYECWSSKIPTWGFEISQ